MPGACLIYACRLSSSMRILPQFWSKVPPTRDLRTQLKDTTEGCNYHMKWCYCFRSAARRSRSVVNLPICRRYWQASKRALPATNNDPLNNRGWKSHSHTADSSSNGEKVTVRKVTLVAEGCISYGPR